MSYETRYAAMKQQQRRERDSSPAAIRERVIWNRAAALAREETKAAFPVVNADNFVAANDYQQARIEFHRAALAKVQP